MELWQCHSFITYAMLENMTVNYYLCLRKSVFQLRVSVVWLNTTFLLYSIHLLDWAAFQLKTFSKQKKLSVTAELYFVIKCVEAYKHIFTVEERWLYLERIFKSRLF